MEVVGGKANRFEEAFASIDERLTRVEEGLKRVEEAIRENRVMTESLRFEIHVIAEGQALLVSKLEEFISALEGRHTAHEDSLKSLQDRTGRLESRMTRVEQFVRIDS